ncbi:MAG: IS30 family transposase [Flavobacterium sp.]|nr:MAG: IS30 family transposase [Flavobacterium sp.]
MTKSYSRLSLKDRIEIQKMICLKKNFSEIAVALSRNKSTISREVNSGPACSYKAMESHNAAFLRMINKRYGKSKILANPKLLDYIHKHLAKRWSPDQISVSLKRNFPSDKTMQASHETIYLYIYLHSKKELKNMLITELRQKRRQRGNVRRGLDKRTTIKDPVRIDERPQEVAGRQIPGHWEGDLILGKNRESAIGTLVERTTRAIILVHLKARDSKTVRKAFEKEFKAIPKQMKKTLTYDNGTEMAQHKLFTKNTKIQVYFTHPYSPWERPTNENSNGLVRDYFPAGTDFSLVTKKRLKYVQDELNERPRKVLDYETPKDVFEKLILEKMN